MGCGAGVPSRARNGAVRSEPLADEGAACGKTCPAETATAPPLGPAESAIKPPSEAPTPPASPPPGTVAVPEPAAERAKEEGEQPAMPRRGGDFGSTVDLGAALALSAALEPTPTNSPQTRRCDEAEDIDEDPLNTTIDPVSARELEARRFAAAASPASLPARRPSVDSPAGDGIAPNFSCTRGPLGVTALSLAGMEAPLLQRSQCWGDQTLSGPGATRGQCLTWVRGDLLGSGSLGSVFGALDQSSGRLIAVKEVTIDAMNAQDVRLRGALEQEVEILRALRHPQIVSYLGHDTIDGNFYIYLEYMPGGSLANVLAQFGPLDESLMRVYTRELLEGLDYLHGRRPPVIHRDIKSANVLVGLDCKVKLSDFGCSKRAGDLAHTMRGSVPWMAPEVIAQTGHGVSADIWSFGCLMIEMATARPPWGKLDNLLAACRRIAMSDDTPPLPETLSASCKDFLEMCLRRDPILRPSTEELLQHELVRDLVEAAPERRSTQEFMELSPEYGTLRELLSDLLE
eukprot:TRINITY_DN29138_c0_g1_i1.p2 TRINITY_DN29138_c0_g1~~TRINITY_DN29138_c0_g1_i1.p2  ORF type:complete len:516 (-),score=119.48 TRINITY_DN29138_c0_g1_i1:1974-3521(-)